MGLSSGERPNIWKSSCVDGKLTLPRHEEKKLRAVLQNLNTNMSKIGNFGHVIVRDILGHGKPRELAPLWEIGEWGSPSGSQRHT